MNKPLKYHNWRFCQSDYDSDQQGVVLAYNYDPWGIGITYTGYALLLVAMIAFFFQRRTYFRAMLKSLTAKQSNNAVVLQRSGPTAKRSYSVSGRCALCNILQRGTNHHDPVAVLPTR